MADQHSPSSPLRIATLNLWGRHGEWEARREALRGGFDRYRADIVAVQEAIVTDGYDQVADVLGTDYAVVHQTVGLLGDGNGAAIASRWPIETVREVDLNLTPRSAGFPCVTLIARVLAPEPIGPVLVANHLPSWQVDYELERELQTVAAARAIEELAPDHAAHVLLLGDLDADPDAASTRFLAGKQSLGGMSVCYQNVWDVMHPGEPGETFTPSNPLVVDRDWPYRRIDHIFVRCGEHGGTTLRIAACGRIFDQPIGGVWASDYFGVVADLEVPVDPTA